MGSFAFWTGWPRTLCGRMKLLHTSAPGAAVKRQLIRLEKIRLYLWWRETSVRRDAGARLT